MENLKALVYEGDLTPYQRALAQREFKDLVERLELLEKAVKNNAVLPHVSGRLEAIRNVFCLWYYAQSQPLDAHKVVDWFASNLR